MKNVNKIILGTMLILVLSGLTFGASQFFGWTIFENVNVKDALFVSKTEVAFPVDMNYEQFITFLSAQDCTNGNFLIPEDGKLVEEKSNITGEDIGRLFFDSGNWRNAVLYICPAQLQNAILRGKFKNRINMAGVDFTGADLRSVDLSNFNFKDIFEFGDSLYVISADLTDIIYNEFTIWPDSFVPPTSAPFTEQ